MFIVNICMVNNAESSTNLYWSVSITNHYHSIPIMITPTNLVVKYPSAKTGFLVFYDRWDDSINSIYYFPKPNDEVIISTNRITRLSHGDAAIGYDFIPVSFTNNLVGFRVEHLYPTKWDSTLTIGPIEYTNQTYYVALSETHVEVGETDIENPNIAKKEDED